MELEPELITKLREAVSAYSRDAKALGIPPERVVIVLKVEAQRAGLDRTGAREFELVMEPALRWCLDEYYGGRAD